MKLILSEYVKDGVLEKEIRGIYRKINKKDSPKD